MPLKNDISRGYLLLEETEDSLGSKELTLEIITVEYDKQISWEVEQEDGNAGFEPVRIRRPACYVREVEGEPLQVLIPYAQTIEEALKQLRRRFKRYVRLGFS